MSILIGMATGLDIVPRYSFSWRSFYMYFVAPISLTGAPRVSTHVSELLGLSERVVVMANAGTVKLRCSG